MTASELATLAYVQYRGDVSPDNELLYAWIDNYNKNAYELLSELDSENFMTEVEITTNPQALASDFDNMRKRSCMVFVKDDNDDISYKLPNTSYGSRKIGFYIDGSNIVLTPQDYDIDDLYYRYIPEISTIDSGDDELIIPDKFKMYFVYQLLADIAIKEEEDSNTIALYQEKATEEEDRIIAYYRKGQSPVVLPW